MRLDTNLLLSLAALGYLPAGSGRVLYGYEAVSNNLVERSDNGTFVERAVVVKPPIVEPHVLPGRARVGSGPGDQGPPVGPGTGDKGSTGPGRLAPGGDHTAPGSSPEDGANPRLGTDPATTDKDPNASKDKDPNSAPTDKDPHAAASDKDSPALMTDEDKDTWCLGDIPAKGAKRSINKRMDPLGVSCFGMKYEPEQWPAEMARRNSVAASRIQNRNYNNQPEWVQRFEQNYVGRQADGPHDSLRSTMDEMGSAQYGFDDPSGYSSFYTYSRNQPLEGNHIAHVSYGSNSGGDRSHVVHHELWSFRDGNRWQHNAEGDPVYRDGNLVPAEGYQQNAIPTSAIVGMNHARSGHAPTARTQYLHFTSENVVNMQALDGIDGARKALAHKIDPRTNRLVLSADSQGLEQEWYRYLLAVDNNYAITNMATTHPQYQNFRPREIHVYPPPNYHMEFIWER